MTTVAKVIRQVTAWCCMRGTWGCCSMPGKKCKHDMQEIFKTCKHDIRYISTTCKLDAYQDDIRRRSTTKIYDIISPTYEHDI